MLRERYNDKKQLILDEKELQLTEEAEVMLCQGDKWYNEIAVYLNGQEDKFEELKPFIVFVAENLCKMDYIAQKFEYDSDSKFADHYTVGYICLDMPDKIILTYYGLVENTEFDVVFQHTDGEFVLKSFGMIKDIPSDWDKRSEAQQWSRRKYESNCS